MEFFNAFGRPVKIEYKKAIANKMAIFDRAGVEIKCSCTSDYRCTTCHNYNPIKWQAVPSKWQAKILELRMIEAKGEASGCIENFDHSQILRNEILKAGYLWVDIPEKIKKDLML